MQRIKINILECFKQTQSSRNKQKIMRVVCIHNSNLLPSCIYLLLRVTALILVKAYILPSFAPNTLQFLNETMIWFNSE